MRVVRGVTEVGPAGGGEGCGGTVVGAGRHGSLFTPDRTVVVQWTTVPALTTARATRAHTTCCSMTTPKSVRGWGRGWAELGWGRGQQRPGRCAPCRCPPPQHHLRSSGKKHGCAACAGNAVSADYDLCTQCYMHNKHDLAHALRALRDGSTSRP